MVAIETGRPLGLGLATTVIRRFGKAHELVGVTRAKGGLLTGLDEALQPVLADRLEHEQALVPDRLEQAEVDERRELAHGRFADRLSGLDREASREHREPGQQTAARLVEQLVAPLDRRAEGALALGRVAGAVGQERQRPLEPCEQRPGREKPRASSRELDRQRQAVESLAYRLNRCVRLDLPADQSGTLDEERDRTGRVERVERELCFAGDPKRRPTRHEYAEARGGGQEVGHRRRSVEDVLEVVQ